MSTATESVSPRTVGYMMACSPEECPGAAITHSTAGIRHPVLAAGSERLARARPRLAGHPDAPADIAAKIRLAARDAFFVDADDWKGMILGQFRAFALQTINGLSTS